MLQTVLADGEERDQLSRQRLELFTRQLEDARQENRIRAQSLSDRQCQTTGLHERLCKLQNEMFSSAFGPPPGAVSVTDTPSTASIAATNPGLVASSASTSRLL